ncbi:MAG: DUF6766 family protein [Chloroflexota bacterium]
MSKATDRGRLGQLWRDYGLSIALFILFLLSFLGHTVSGWFQYASEQRTHDEPAVVFGDDGYVWYWAEWTLQNWQSEFLELAAIVVLSAYLIHKGSAESKDGEDEMKAMLTSIEEKLGEIEASQRKPQRKAS